MLAVGDHHAATHKLLARLEILDFHRCGCDALGKGAIAEGDVGAIVALAVAEEIHLVVGIIAHGDIATHDVPAVEHIGRGVGANKGGIVEAIASGAATCRGLEGAGGAIKTDGISACGNLVVGGEEIGLALIVATIGIGLFGVEEDVDEPMLGHVVRVNIGLGPGDVDIALLSGLVLVGGGGLAARVILLDFYSASSFEAEDFLLVGGA